MKRTTTKKEKSGAINTGLSESLTFTTNQSKFTGTRNPRHLRVLIVLMHAAGRDVRRETVDKVAGASNGPELVAELRRRGLHLPCDRIATVDRDGLPCRPGVYWLTREDFRKLSEWIDTNPLGSVTDGERA
jgi:hypothetical protein